MCVWYGSDENMAENSKFVRLVLIYSLSTTPIPPYLLRPSSARSLNPTNVVVDTTEYSMKMLNRLRLMAYAALIIRQHSDVDVYVAAYNIQNS